MKREGVTLPAVCESVVPQGDTPWSTRQDNRPTPPPHDEPIGEAARPRFRLRILAASAHAPSSVGSSEWRSKSEPDCQIGSPTDISLCMARRAGQADAERDRIGQVLKCDLVRPADLLGTCMPGAIAADRHAATSPRAPRARTGQSGTAGSIAAARCQVRPTCERVALLRHYLGNIYSDRPPRQSASR